MMNDLKAAVCPVCKNIYEKRMPNQRVCSPECRAGFYNRVSTLGIAAGSVGTISEMMVCCYFLEKGYSVFRAVSPSSFCDVVVIKQEEILRLEVRTGYQDVLGNFIFSKKLSTKISLPTHYAVYIPKTNEIKIIEITEKEKIKWIEFNKRK